MCKSISDHIVSALLGGIVGAIVVLLAAGQMPTTDVVHAQIEQEMTPSQPSGKFKTLEVENLVITNQASLLNQEGKAEVVIKDGSLLAEKTVLGHKVIGRQIQSHAIVANRMFTTPDDLMTMPMESWRFGTEVGSSAESGGEVLVRSGAGFSTVNKATTDGAFLRAGFDPESRPQILALQNGDRRHLPINFELSEEQRKILEAHQPNVVR